MFLLRPWLCVLALASTPLVSPAADRILISRIAPTQATLFISNADGSGEQPVMPPGSLDYNPAWSPKGDWIVFTSERAGSADLYRIHPDGTGLDLMRSLQSQQPIPAVALSGYGMEDDLQKCKEAGFRAHLLKPIKIDQLRQILGQISPS